MATRLKAKPFRLYAEFTRSDDEERMVEGFCYVNAVCGDGWDLTREAIADAAADYLKFPAIRSMHQPLAAGSADLVEVQDDGRVFIRAYIVDDAEWKKVKKKVYRGFSIGGKPRVLRGRKIEKFDWIETSLVDRPMDPDAVFTLVRSEGADLEDVCEVIVLGEDETLERVDGAEEGATERAATPAVPGPGDGPTEVKPDDPAVGMEGPDEGEGDKDDPKADVPDFDEHMQGQMDQQKFDQIMDALAALTDIIYGIHKSKLSPADRELKLRDTLGKFADHVTPHVRGDDGTAADAPARAEALADEDVARAEEPVAATEAAPAIEVERAVAPATAPDGDAAADTEGDGEEEDEKKKAKAKGKEPEHLATEGEFDRAADADAADQKYPLDTEEHIRAAWAYLQTARSRKGYSEEELGHIETRIKDAAKEHQVELGEGETERSANADALSSQVPSFKRLVRLQAENWSLEAEVNRLETARASLEEENQGLVERLKVSDDELSMVRGELTQAREEVERLSQEPVPQQRPVVFPEALDRKFTANAGKGDGSTDRVGELREELKRLTDSKERDARKRYENVTRIGEIKGELSMFGVIV